MTDRYERIRAALSHAHICSKLAEQYKSDPVLFAALTDAAAIIHDLMRNVLKEAARVCKDLDDEALAKENRLACGAECAAAIADLGARMNVPLEGEQQ